MKTSLLITLFFLLVTPVVADRNCGWHAANDDAPDFLHYDSLHDSDGDGIGCDTITDEGTAIETTITLIELDETGSFIEQSPTAPAVPSVELLVNSNFRRGPGLAFAIVGGGSPGSVYQWTSVAYGSGGWIWYELVLPAGSGWVRGDLIRLLDAVETQNSP